MSRAVGEIIGHLERHRTLAPQLVASIGLPPHRESVGDLSRPLPGALRDALERLGIGDLWSHQAAALEAIRAGRDTLVTTPTASGKSLVFQLPVLEEQIGMGPGRALFLYPLKALGQDQMGKILTLAGQADMAADSSLCSVYDGDTPERDRQRIRRSPPRIVISNPDMLHVGILGSWQAWEPFLRCLRWLVLDELHTYRGIFGSHFHHVLQRLLRICRELGSDPVVVASSATAANAGDFAEALVGRQFEWITDSGAPRAGRRFLLFRPVASPYTLTLDLLAELLDSGLKTIVFTKARRITELLVAWFRRQRPDLARRVAGYRSGFLPSERRQIEADLFSGRLDGVISTSALEMGVDVGGLDACILVGFPGSVMATWQRSGRVGRGDRESITSLVALPDALDQYFLAHPSALLERPLEQLIVDPANEPVSRGHLVCAASERPLDRDLDRAYLDPLAGVVDELLGDELLEERVDGRILVSRLSRPHREVRLRGAGDSVSVVDAASGRVVGTVDGVRVLHECHPGAVYLHQGRQYLVRELDLAGKRVVGEALSVDYYTTPLTEKETTILEVLGERGDAALAACLGRLLVTERVVGYERRDVRSQELLGQHDLVLPEARYETVGLWWIAPPELEELLRGRGFHVMGALHAAEHATISLVPLFALCDRGDIGGISIPLHPQLECGAVFVYDGHPGGVGIAARAFADLPDLLQRVVALIESCRCEEGCPSCIQSPKCGNGNRPLDKEGARVFLESLLSGDGASERRARPVAGRAHAPEPPGDVDSLDEEDDGRGATGHARARSGDGRWVSNVVEGGGGEASAAATEQRDRTMILEIEPRRSLSEVGSGNAHRMRIAEGAVCHLEAGRIEIFDEDEVLELLTLLESAERVVGFGIERMALPVLGAYTGVDYVSRWNVLDLERDLTAGAGRQAPLLEAITADFGGAGTAPRDHEGGLRGCRERLERVRDLYLYGRRMGEVVVPDEDAGERAIPVDW